MYTSTRSTAVSNEQVRRDEPWTGMELSVAQISSEVRDDSGSAVGAMKVGVADMGVDMGEE